MLGVFKPDGHSLVPVDFAHALLAVEPAERGPDDVNLYVPRVDRFEVIKISMQNHQFPLTVQPMVSN